ncbi:MAG: CapA family protein [Planctomycetota bacterium]|nr:CapA family protein [Planctomycetota bacterium]
MKTETGRGSRRPIRALADGRVRLAEGPVIARLLFSGDLCPINRVERMLTSGDITRAFGDTMELFAAADLAVVNLEAPLCRKEAPIRKCGPNFRADPRTARSLAAAGVDVCCLANNHVMDQGAAGLRWTLAALDSAGLRHVGAGPDQTAAGGPLRIEIRGIWLALLNFGIVEGAAPMEGPGAARLEAAAVLRATAAAAETGSLTIAVLHAGREEVPLPSPQMRDLCRGLVEAGAAAVVCHHPHVPQGIEFHRNRPIAYSLGNFLFDWHEPEPHTDSGFLLELGVSRRDVVELAVHPFRKSAAGGAGLLRGRDRAEWLRFLRDLSEPLADERLMVRLWKEQCRMQLGAGYPNRLKRLAGLFSPDAGERMRAGLTMLNLLRGFEHNEVLQEALTARVTGDGKSDRGARRILEGLDRRLRAFGAPGGRDRKEELA